MKAPFRAIALGLAAFGLGLVLLLASIYLAGYTAAFAWPTWYTAFAKSHRPLGWYAWWVVFDGVPQIALSAAVGWLAFRFLARAWSSLAGLALPYLVFVISSDNVAYRLTTSWALTADMLIGCAPVPAGLYLAWRLSSRRPPSMLVGSAGEPGLSAK